MGRDPTHAFRPRLRSAKPPRIGLRVPSSPPTHHRSPPAASDENEAGAKEVEVVVMGEPEVEKREMKKGWSIVQNSSSKEGIRQCQATERNDPTTVPRQPLIFFPGPTACGNPRSTTTAGLYPRGCAHRHANRVTPLTRAQHTHPPLPRPAKLAPAAQANTYACGLPLPLPRSAGSLAPGSAAQRTPHSANRPSGPPPTPARRAARADQQCMRMTKRFTAASPTAPGKYAGPCMHAQARSENKFKGYIKKAQRDSAHDNTSTEIGHTSDYRATKGGDNPSPNDKNHDLTLPRFGI
uniref:Uncharacterized protein n=1 Tax=Oryza nivara TaxID=4536 RepID=A0A0E0FRR3_ORYNI